MAASARTSAAGRALARSAEARSAPVRARVAIARAARAPAPLVLGPWRSEIGFELLYWIPFLRWFTAHHGRAPEELVAVSRGGAEPWYRDVASTYVELFDSAAPEELRAAAEGQVAAAGTRKQWAGRAFDRELLRRAGLGARAALLPSAMYDLFRWFWAGRPLAGVARRTHYRPLPPREGPPPPALAALPERYVAVKAYFSDCFPETRENHRFVAETIAGLAHERPVVLLSTGLRLDDHEELSGAGGGVVDASDLMSARDNLAVQTEIVRGADALVATYGGFSYLGPFLGVPSSSFFSRRTFLPQHLELMGHAGRELAAAGRPAAFRAVPIEEFPPARELCAGLAAASR